MKKVLLFKTRKKLIHIAFIILFFISTGISTFGREINEYEKSNEILQNEICDLNKEINKLKADINKQKIINESLVDKIIELKGKDNKNDDYTRLVSEINHLRNKINNINIENNFLKEEIAKKKDENIKLVSENNDLIEKNKSLDNENNSLKDEIANKKEENEKLQKEMLDNSEISVDLKTQINDLKKFVDENSKDLNQVEGTTKLVTVRKILTSAKALEQLKHIVTVVEVLLYKDKMVIRLDDFEEKLNWPDDEELIKNKFDENIVREKCEEFRQKLSILFDKAKRLKKEQSILFIPSCDKNSLPSPCWNFFQKMFNSGFIKDTSFIKNLYMPDNFIHIKGN